MSRSRFDRVTFAVWIGTPLAWLVVELAIMWLRLRHGAGEPVAQTISMVARDRGWQLTAAVFFWSAMPVHFWVPGRWASGRGTVAFWCVVAALLAWNVTALAAGWTATPPAEWSPVLRWLNWPVWYLALGPLAAALLFPQDGPVPWRP